MIKNILTTLGFLVAFGLGFAFKTLTTKERNEKTTIKKVTGIGGIFFKCNDPKNMRAWYSKHLGLNTNEYGATFEWKEATDVTQNGETQWSPFSEKTNYFAPSTKDFMINYRVANLKTLVASLKIEGVTVLDKITSDEYGKFVHIMDDEGNKIELWEPVITLKNEEDKK